MLFKNICHPIPVWIKVFKQNGPKREKANKDCYWKLRQSNAIKLKRIRDSYFLFQNGSTPSNDNIFFINHCDIKHQSESIFFLQDDDACNMPNECFCFKGETDHENLCNNTLLISQSQGGSVSDQSRSFRVNNGRSKVFPFGPDLEKGYLGEPNKPLTLLG